MNIGDWVRLGLTVAMIVMVYQETGFFTALAISLISFNIEAQNYLRNKGLD